MQISSQHPGLMKPFKKTCSSVFPTAFLSVWVLEVSTCKLLCNFEQILSHTFVYLSCSYTFIYILSNSFDVFVFCACSQAFQPTLSRATEIASRSSLRSMKFILSRTQTGRKPARHSSSVLSGPSGTQRTEPWAVLIRTFLLRLPLSLIFSDSSSFWPVRVFVCFGFRLKSLFYRSSNLQYFKRLIQIPQLPEVRTTFTTSYIFHIWMPPTQKSWSLPLVFLMFSHQKPITRNSY